jgi:hypothetical protein
MSLLILFLSLAILTLFVLYLIIKTIGEAVVAFMEEFR